MTEMEKYEAGLPFSFLDPEVAKMKENALRLCRAFNELDTADLPAQMLIIKELFSACGEQVFMQPPFNCDVGSNIKVGKDFLSNYNVKILDMGTVHIGDYCMIGPNTVISTVNHPITASERRQKISMVKPVVIGDDVWIGANCTILPGVTIGSNVVIAAGAVVTNTVADCRLRSRGT
ncbi:sugar O-acetyltransferase [Pseudarthrobacter psychrotolerans]|uniref:Acetyltransferase n=1 Tax=Pseudarthrobacter psychrotolerans TaxID=2697569 RepID=A0A6P1NN75_9MICC|nr:sugar O-acetyltransferase [Pseudarthrobacter psychrotolerans]